MRLVVKKILLNYSLQEVRWDKGSTIKAGDYNFFCEIDNKYHQLRTGLFVFHRIVSAIKRVEFVSDRMTYIVLRGCWFNYIVLNMQAPSEEKSGDSKGSLMGN
jgi:hypothetical protein